MAEFTAPDADRELLPARRFEWERIVRRVRMPVTTRCVALLLASYGNPNGSRIRPGRDRLARVADVSPKTVSRSIVALRTLGLIELVSAGSGSARHNSAAEYRLTLPSDILDDPAMLDPDESDPVDNPVDAQVAGDTRVPRSESSRGHLREEHGTSGDQHGTPVSGAWDIAMSTYQIRPDQETPDYDHASVPPMSTSRPSPGDDDEDDGWPSVEKCECDDTGFLGYDDDMRPIPCTNCRPHLARVIPLDERRTG